MSRTRFYQFAALIAILLGLAWPLRPDRLVHVWFLEGAGDGFLIQTPSGAHILIDGGSDPVALASGLGQHMPFWKHELDLVILTGSFESRLPGQVAALTRYHANRVIAALPQKKSALLSQWQSLVQAANANFEPLRSGKRWMIDSVEFRVIGDTAQGGGVIYMQYGRSTVILAHTIDEKSNHLLPRSGHASLIALPWQIDPHTQIEASAAPQAIVFTNGYAADHPAALTMPERAVGDARVYHERLNGTIEWRSDGQTSMVVVERHYCTPSRSWFSFVTVVFRNASASCSSRDRS